MSFQDVKGKGQVTQIGNQFYYIEVCFYNGVYENPVFLPFNIIEELMIKQNLSQWWTTGHIILNNDYQFLEKGADIKKPSGEWSSINGYICDRPDGRNKFSIRLYPTNISDSQANDFVKRNIDDFEICHDFVVYDVQDVPTQNAEKKYKKYYLWDERYQLFLERNLEWSTALAAKKLFKIESFTRDIDRKLNPNLALLSLINDASFYPDGSPIKVGFSGNGKINDPEYFISDIKDEEWDVGVEDEKNRIFYSCLAGTNVIDAINDIYPYCQSSDGFPVILSLGKSTSDKRFKLKSLKAIFDESYKNQKERLIFFDTKDADVSNKTWAAKGPEFGVNQNQESELLNFTSGIASKVTSYQFVPMSPVDDLNFATSPLSYFNPETSEFNINFSKNTIENFYTKAKEMASNLFNLKKDKRGDVLLKINKMKEDTGIIKHKFSALETVPENLPMVQMLKDFIFLNQSLVFSTYGLTIRNPGNFFTLESIHSSDKPNDFWDKFLGQWMIVDVEHKFTKHLYSTVVTANKIDVASKIMNVKDSNYIA